MKKKIFIWGAGGHGRVVLDILKTNKKFEIIGFIDSDKRLKGETIYGFKVFGGKECLKKMREKNIRAGIVAIGDIKKRCEIADYLKQKKFNLINAIHPKAIINSNVTLGSNITIAAGAIICTDSNIEDNVIINTGVIVEHQNIIRNGVHIAPGAQLAGFVEVGERAFIGIGATIIHCVKIGKNSVIGAGSVVLNGIPDNVMAVGIPAKIIKERFNLKEEGDY